MAVIIAMKCVCIKPNTSLHIGERGYGIEQTGIFPHSDTIFSGICNCYAYIKSRDALESLIEKFIEEPPFLISSALPMIFFDNNAIFFLPKPKVAPRNLDYELSKMFKSGEYVSFDAFKRIVESSLSANKDLKLLSKCIVTPDEYKLIKDFDNIRCGHIARNAIGRLTSKSSIYYCGASAFPKNWGFYFLFKGEDTWLKNIEPSLRLLSDEGLGGERSIGYGRFGFDIKEIDVPTAKDSILMTLSLYHPLKEEIASFLKNPMMLSYRLIKRGGYAFSPFINAGLLKRWVRMFAEGSIFPKIDQKIVYGHLIKVIDEKHAPHPVYRYGYAFTVGLGDLSCWVE